MNRHQIINIMRQPQLLNEQTLPEIRVILDEYPFFQAARMLWVKNLHALDNIRYNNELKFASIHISDRARLYDLLFNSKPVTSIEAKLEISESDKAKEQKTSEVIPSVPATVPISGDVLNYFDVDDTVDTPSGETVDFSKFNQKNNVKADSLNFAFPLVEDNMVLPSADLLDYERSFSDGYTLSDAEEETNNEEYRSFSSWLKVLRNKPAFENEKPVVENVVKVKEVKRDLIDNFLQMGTKSKLRNVGESSKISENEDISLKSLQESEDLMTETLANIHIKQKHFSKAIEIFERLRLKYPEKNIYFARRIKELEEQINNQ